MKNEYEKTIKFKEEALASSHEQIQELKTTLEGYKKTIEYFQKLADGQEQELTTSICNVLELNDETKERSMNP